MISQPSNSPQCLRKASITSLGNPTGLCCFAICVIYLYFATSNTFPLMSTFSKLFPYCHSEMTELSLYHSLLSSESLNSASLLSFSWDTVTDLPLCAFNQMGLWLSVVSIWSHQETLTFCQQNRWTYRWKSSVCVCKVKVFFLMKLSHLNCVVFLSFWIGEVPIKRYSSRGDHQWKSFS